MAKRTRAGVVGVETPRPKDMLRKVGSGRKRTVDTDKRAKKAIVKALLAFLDKHGADAATCARLLKEYRAFVRGLPSRSASVCDLVANRIRNLYLAEFYSLEAKRVGVAKPAGAKLAGSAHSCDMHVQRFSLHARDLAYREAGLPTESTTATEEPAGTSPLHEELIAKLQRLADQHASDAAQAAPVDLSPPPMLPERSDEPIAVPSEPQSPAESPGPEDSASGSVDGLLAEIRNIDKEPKGAPCGFMFRSGNTQHYIPASSEAGAWAYIRNELHLAPHNGTLTRRSTPFAPIYTGQTR